MYLVSDLYEVIALALGCGIFFCLFNCCEDYATNKVKCICLKVTFLPFLRADFLFYSLFGNCDVKMLHFGATQSSRALSFLFFVSLLL